MALINTSKPKEVNKKDIVEQDSKLIKFMDSQHARVNNIKDLLGEFPAKDGVYYLWTMKSFNAFTFITYVIKYREYIEELTFSTYGINTRIVEALFKWLDKGKIGHINIFMSDSANYRIPKVIDLLKSHIDTRPGKVDLFFGWNHSKITLMKTAHSYFTVTGSGNFSENARHEQYTFADNANLYRFYAKNILDNANL